MKALSPQQWLAHEINAKISTNNFILVQLCNCIKQRYTPARVQAEISCLYWILSAYFIDHHATHKSRDILTYRIAPNFRDQIFS